MHIRSVDFINKKVNLYVNVTSLRFPNCNVDVGEFCGRGAGNNVAWGSLISVAEGHWNGK